MRIATHPEAIKHLVKIGMAADISEHIKMVESANESLIKEKDELRSVAEDNKRECEATRIENARLKAEVERLTDKIRVSDNHAQCLEFVINSGTANELRLQAQVERLTKAGDAMASWVGEDTHFWWGQPEAAVEAWNAAKEGKPRA